MPRRKTILADPFEVWGKPPQIVLDQLGRKDHDRLRRYITRVIGKVYPIIYSAGERAGRRKARRSRNGEYLAK